MYNEGMIKGYGTGRRQAASVRSRWLWAGLAYTCVGLGALGSVLPVLPTTPFLLVALWAATRSSPKLRFKLYRHKRYGLLLRNWHRHGVVPTTGKWLACSVMLISALTLWLSNAPLPVLLMVGTVFVAASIFILSRPSRI